MMTANSQDAAAIMEEIRRVEQQIAQKQQMEEEIRKIEAQIAAAAAAAQQQQTTTAPPPAAVADDDSEYEEIIEEEYVDEEYEEEVIDEETEEYEEEIIEEEEEVDQPATAAAPAPAVTAVAAAPGPPAAAAGPASGQASPPARAAAVAAAVGTVAPAAVSHQKVQQPPEQAPPLPAAAAAANDDDSTGGVAGDSPIAAAAAAGAPPPRIAPPSTVAVVDDALAVGTDLIKKFKRRVMPSSPAPSPAGQETVMEKLVGPKLYWNERLQKAGTAACAVGHRFIGLYIAAAWRRECKQFTPALLDFYKIASKQNPGIFEVIYVSSDRSLIEFKDCMKKLPFPAMVSGTSALKNHITRELKICELPALVVLEASTGLVVSSTAMEEISSIVRKNATEVGYVVEHWKRCKPVPFDRVELKQADDGTINKTGFVYWN